MTTLTRASSTSSRPSSTAPSNREIAERPGLREQTVKNDLQRIFDKLGVSTRLELASYAVHHKLLAHRFEP